MSRTATDSPGIDRNKHGSIKLGSGPTVTHGTANHPEVVKRLITLANELEIPIQHEASSRSTGTDTDHVYCDERWRPKRAVVACRCVTCIRQSKWSISAMWNDASCC